MAPQGYAPVCKTERLPVVHSFDRGDYNHEQVLPRSSH